MSGGLVKGVWPGLTSKRAINYLLNWSRSGAQFGVAGGVATAFFFDWKYVLQYVPFINTKWQTNDK